MEKRGLIHMTHPGLTKEIQMIRRLITQSQISFDINIPLPINEETRLEPIHGNAYLTHLVCFEFYHQPPSALPSM